MDINDRFIRFVDQDGQAITIDVRQDGGNPRWVPRGRRTRFKIRHQTVALRIERIAIVNASEWRVNDIKIGGFSQFSDMTQIGDTTDEDGMPADALAAVHQGGALDGFMAFHTAQTAMDIDFDVTYHGGNPDGQPFGCSVQCTAAR